MKTFFRLKKTSYYFVAIDLCNKITELKHCDTEIVESALKGTNYCSYQEEKTPVPPMLRLTMPFFFIVAMVFILLLPVTFMITGRWGYMLLWFTNWGRALGL